MTLRKAILRARIEKCKIKNESLRVPMYGMSAKDLIHWLIMDQDDKKKPTKRLKVWLCSKTWELDYEN